MTSKYWLNKQLVAKLQNSSPKVFTYIQCLSANVQTMMLCWPMGV